MSRVLLPLLIACMFSETTQAQPQSLVDVFERRSQVHEGFQINYRLFVPTGYDPATSYPLVLALHGSGERGADNERQIANHRMATAWADPAAQAKNPAFVFAPQAPAGGTWTSDAPAEGEPPPPPAREMLTVYAILDSLASEFTIDPDRVYVTGLSMGGFGTFSAVFDAPERFAAAVPMSGGFLDRFVEDMGAVPFWIIHGDQDTAVDVYWSQLVVAGFERLGRHTVYTHCRPFACDRLSDAQVDEALADRPDLIYSELPGEGHVIWAPWYDNPRLQDWVFAQHRHSETVDLETPVDGTSGTKIVNWMAAGTGVSVDLWISDNLGRSWNLVNSGANDGSEEVSVAELNDTPFALLRLDLVDEDGFVIGRSESPFFTIDHAADGSPVAAVEDFQFRFVDEIVDPILTLTYLAGDAESSTLAGFVSFSADGGDSFTTIEPVDISTSIESQTLEIDVSSQPNTDRAVVRLEVSDGVHMTSAETPVFSKQTERLTSGYVEHPEGSGEATVVISFVQSEDLTGHRYQITFQILASGAKTYTVRDLDTGLDVLMNVPITGGEGPMFDGIRLTIRDLNKAKVNVEQSGWTAGDADVSVTATAPRVNVGGKLLDLLATPADYRITISEETPDTSSTLFGFPAFPMRFLVENLTTGGARDILFLDRDSNGLPTPSDLLYILEDNEDGELTLAWLIAIGSGTNLPEPGDVFELITIKPVTEADVFEFVGQIGVASEVADLPGGFALGQNYPNPFLTDTTIPVQLDAPSVLELTVYDVLGRQVASLFDGTVGAGKWTVSWQASDLPAGLYFVRMKIGGLDKMVVATKLK